MTGSVDGERNEVIYTAGPGKVEAVLSILESHGLHPVNEVAAPFAMPWIGAGLAQTSVAVPASEVREARLLLDGFEAPNLERANTAARRVGPRLLLATVLVVGSTALLIASRGARRKTRRSTSSTLWVASTSASKTARTRSVACFTG